MGNRKPLRVPRRADQTSPLGKTINLFVSRRSQSVTGGETSWAAARSSTGQIVSGPPRAGSSVTRDDHIVSGPCCPLLCTRGRRAAEGRAPPTAVSAPGWGPPATRPLPAHRSHGLHGTHDDVAEPPSLLTRSVGAVPEAAMAVPCYLRSLLPPTAATLPRAGICRRAGLGSAPGKTLRAERQVAVAPQPEASPAHRTSHGSSWSRPGS